MFKRVILLIFDACGVGELPDAAEYGDIGSATIPNIASELGGLSLPNCEKMGLGNIIPIMGVKPAKKPLANFGKMAEKSAGKDSTSGHWEIGGVILERPFPVYPDGFPADIIRKFEKAAQVKVIGNYPASGTEIIAQLGQQHFETGKVILYTSADSVFQLAAHEEIIPIDKLYRICRIARDLLKGEYAVGRVIARPFIGKPGEFVRTSNRRDFSLEPISITILDKLIEADIPVIAIGKIYDLFAGRGFSKAIKTKDNNDVMAKVIDEMSASKYGLIFANLVDFDMLWGHRNNTVAFGRGLEEADKMLGGILNILNDDDLLIITADHGCDPTIKSSTDHTREYVPLLVYNSKINMGQNLGVRATFADIANSLADIFGVNYNFPGKAFWKN